MAKNFPGTGLTSLAAHKAMSQEWNYIHKEKPTDLETLGLWPIMPKNLPRCCSDEEKCQNFETITCSTWNSRRL